MATRQYIGARYIPKFADPVEWDATNAYEYLTMVQHVGETYMSKQNVPVGAPLPDTSQGEESTEYWVHMSNWNAQVETYRQEVLQYNGRISTLEDDLPTSGFDSTNTVKKAIDDTNDLLPAASFDSVNTVKKAIDDISDLLPVSDFDTTNTVKAAITSVENDITEIKKRITPYDFTGKRFAFIGDSITKGQSGAGTYYEHPWCWTLCDIVGATCYNYAVGGATWQSTNVEAAENFAEQTNNVIITDWGDHDPDYLFIMLGTNDYGLNANIGDFAGNMGYTTVTSAMITGITALRTQFPNMVIIGVIPPFMPGDTVRNSVGMTALDYKTVIKNQYDILNVPTIDFTTALSFDATNWPAHIWDSVSPRLHPNQATHDMMGKIAAGMLPSLCNRMYTMCAAKTFSGSLTLENGATGNIYWWIDEQNNTHIYAESVKLPASPAGYVVTTLPAYLRPQLVYYDHALNLNTGEHTFVHADPNGELHISVDDTPITFHITIPQLLKSINSGNIR